MKTYKLMVLIATMILVYNFSSFASEKKEFVIIDKAYSARILSEPLSDNSLGRIPAGTKAQIFKKQQARSGMLTQTWYFVKYNNIEGWISQYVTMGDIITEYENTGVV